LNSIEKLNRDYWMKIRHPYSCGIELTPFCNMNCIHCYMQDYRTEKLLTADKVIRILDILYEQGILFVYFTGGEIFTFPGFIDVYLYAKKKGFIVELLTNITLLTDEVLAVFEKYPPANISISVYGASEKTYSEMTRSQGNYARVIHNLQLLSDAGLHFEIKFIGTRKNASDFTAVEDIAKCFNVAFRHSFELFPTLEQSPTPMEYMLSAKEIVEIEKSYPITCNRWANQCEKSPSIKDAPVFFCDIATSSFIIDCEGYMEPCNKLRTRKYSVLESPFSEIWESFASFKKAVAPQDYKCASCENRGLCIPCPAENLLSTGQYHTPAPHTCELAAERMAQFSDGQYDCYRKTNRKRGNHDGISSAPAGGCVPESQC